MRVIVVGATGHIGSYLVPRLVAGGHEVIAISRGQRRPYFEDAAWQDVHQLRMDRDADEAAGSFGARLAAEQPGAVVDLTCFTEESARQMVDALAPLGCYLLHCGTIWVHGSSVEVPVREDAPRRPFGEYGTRKAAIEMLLLDEARRGRLPCTVLHPGHIVGPGWAPVNPAGHFNLNVFGALAAGDELALPNLGLETVHHVHADDVAQLFERALGRPEAASGQAFHVVSERAITLRGYADAVAAWYGKKARLKFEPWDNWAAHNQPADAAATWDHIAHSPSMSIEKATSVLGYQPRFTSLQAVFESLCWLVGHGQVAGDAAKLDFVSQSGD